MEITLVEKESIRSFQLPEYTEIPDVGLYLKQVVKYINETVGEPLGFSVTDTMLSNYVKMHIAPSPVKKMYYRDHIIILMFIAMAKSVLSLENITTLFKFQEEHYSVFEAYGSFKRYFANALVSVFEGTPAGLNVENPRPEQILLNKIVTAMSYKYYLDACFK